MYNELRVLTQKLIMKQHNWWFHFKCIIKSFLCLYTSQLYIAIIYKVKSK